jgi:hypothetical protein
MNQYHQRNVRAAAIVSPVVRGIQAESDVTLKYFLSLS